MTDIILTGDRPTGQLHLGHFVGSLQARVHLQHTHKQYLLLADTQALTDNSDNIEKVKKNILEVATDYLAVGIDPDITTITLQSHLTPLFELTSLLMNYVTVSRLERNPTIKNEIQLRGFERDIPAGFLMYPVSQTADIVGFDGTCVPVGEDQKPMIEQSNEIIRKVNHQAGRHILRECKALLSDMPRLPGVDGKNKMSKSLGNTIVLDSTDQDIKKVINLMYTDEKHISIHLPGQVEGNVVFSYLDFFDPNQEELEELKQHYSRGGLGDKILKNRLEAILIELIGPIRERRLALKKRPDYVMDIVLQGSDIGKKVTQANLDRIKDGLGLFRF